MEGLSRCQLETSLKVLGELQRVIAVLYRVSATEQRLDITPGMRYDLYEFCESARDAQIFLNERIIWYNEELEVLDRIEAMFG